MSYYKIMYKHNIYNKYIREYMPVRIHHIVKLLHDEIHVDKEK